MALPPDSSRALPRDGVDTGGPQQPTTSAGMEQSLQQSTRDGLPVRRARHSIAGPPVTSVQQVLSGSPHDAPPRLGLLRNRSTRSSRNFDYTLPTEEHEEEEAPRPTSSFRGTLPVTPTRGVAINPVGALSPASATSWPQLHQPAGADAAPAPAAATVGPLPGQNPSEQSPSTSRPSLLRTFSANSSAPHMSMAPPALPKISTPGSALPSPGTPSSPAPSLQPHPPTHLPAPPASPKTSQRSLGTRRGAAPSPGLTGGQSTPTSSAFATNSPSPLSPSAASSPAATPMRRSASFFSRLALVSPASAAAEQRRTPYGSVAEAGAFISDDEESSPLPSVTALTRQLLLRSADDDELERHMSDPLRASGGPTRSSSALPLSEEGPQEGVRGLTRVMSLEADGAARSAAAGGRRGPSDWGLGLGALDGAGGAADQALDLPQLPPSRRGYASSSGVALLGGAAGAGGAAGDHGVDLPLLNAYHLGYASSSGAAGVVVGSSGGRPPSGEDVSLSRRRAALSVPGCVSRVRLFQSRGAEVVPEETDEDDDDEDEEQEQEQRGGGGGGRAGSRDRGPSAPDVAPLNEILDPLLDVLDPGRRVARRCMQRLQNSGGASPGGGRLRVVETWAEGDFARAAPDGATPGDPHGLGSAAASPAAPSLASLAGQALKLPCVGLEKLSDPEKRQKVVQRLKEATDAGAAAYAHSLLAASRPAGIPRWQL